MGWEWCFKQTRLNNWFCLSGKDGRKSTNSTTLSFWSPTGHVGGTKYVPVGNSGKQQDWVLWSRELSQHWSLTWAVGFWSFTNFNICPLLTIRQPFNSYFCLNRVDLHLSAAARSWSRSVPPSHSKSRYVVYCLQQPHDKKLRETFLSCTIWCYSWKQAFAAVFLQDTRMCCRGDCRILQRKAASLQFQHCKLHRPSTTRDSLPA